MLANNANSNHHTESKQRAKCIRNKWTAIAANLLDFAVRVLADRVLVDLRIFIVPLLLVRWHDTVVVDKRRVTDLIADLHPDVTDRRDREEHAKQVVGDGCNDEAHEKVEAVNVCRTNRDFRTDCTGETDDIDENAKDIGNVSAPMDAHPEVVWPDLAAAVQILDLQVSFAYS